MGNVTSGLQRTEPRKYGEPKKRYQIMLTKTMADKVDETARELGITRSEVLEQLCRNQYLSNIA